MFGWAISHLWLDYYAEMCCTCCADLQELQLYATCGSDAAVRVYDDHRRQPLVKLTAGDGETCSATPTLSLGLRWKAGPAGHDAAVAAAATSAQLATELLHGVCCWWCGADASGF